MISPITAPAMAPSIASWRPPRAPPPAAPKSTRTIGTRQPTATTREALRLTVWDKACCPVGVPRDGLTFQRPGSSGRRWAGIRRHGRKPGGGGQGNGVHRTTAGLRCCYRRAGANAVGEAADRAGSRLLGAAGGKAIDTERWPPWSARSRMSLAIGIKAEQLLCLVDRIDPAVGCHWLAQGRLVTKFAGQPEMFEPNKHGGCEWSSIGQPPNMVIYQTVAVLRALTERGGHVDRRGSRQDSGKSERRGSICL